MPTRCLAKPMPPVRHAAKAMRWKRRSASHARTSLVRSRLTRCPGNSESRTSVPGNRPSSPRKHPPPEVSRDEQDGPIGSQAPESPSFASRCSRISFHVFLRYKAKNSLKRFTIAVMFPRTRFKYSCSCQTCTRQWIVNATCAQETVGVVHASRQR